MFSKWKVWFNWYLLFSFLHICIWSFNRYTLSKDIFFLLIDKNDFILLNEAIQLRWEIISRLILLSSFLIPLNNFLGCTINDWSLHAIYILNVFWFAIKLLLKCSYCIKFAFNWTYTYFHQVILSISLILFRIRILYHFLRRLFIFDMVHESRSWT